MKRIVAIVIVGCSAVVSGQSPSGSAVEWPYVGGDQAHTKYSALDDIDLSNVDQLEMAWQWDAGETPLPAARPGSFQATPLMIDDTLYFSTAFSRVVALDADTGEQRWVYDPRVYEDAPRGASPAGFHHRGLAFRRDGDALTLFLNSRTRLYAIDASTGQLIESFGEQGSVLLTEGHGRDVPPETYDQTSPPVVYDDLVIVGSRVPDRVQKEYDTPGSVQAFDALTGERRWIFFTVPQSNDAFGADTWENQSWRITGHANVWGLMSLDEERGLLYVPTSTPSSDYWGGRRPGANLFAESILCLDARTGERLWHFQAVHHGLWDYDFTAAPNLVTITVDGRTIDAVAEVSKQGFTYVFDRVTGEPVWPIEERPVDTTTDVPGEVPYPTQPFPTRPPPFAGQGVSLDDANDLTPEIHAMAVEEMQQFRLGPLFTPPSLRGTLQRPNVAGGSNWGGAAFDPESGLLYVRSSESTSTNQVCRNEGTDPDVDVEFTNNCPHGAAAMIFQLGNRPGAVEVARSRLGPIPLIKPPYGRVTAIDLNRGEIAWQMPLGEGSRILRNHPLLRGVELPDRLGGGGRGPLVTKGGLVFVGSSDGHLYTFNKTTGEEVWRGATPFRPGGNPMTYRTTSGRQFVVVPTGAGPDAALVAFATGSNDQQLVEAAAARDSRTVRALLSDGVDVNSSRADGTTALHWAVHRDDLELVELLMQAGADVDVSTDNGVTPLALACENRSVPVVDRLLAAGADVNVAKTSGETPLMMAARTGNLEVVEALLARGADVNRRTHKSLQTALMWAVAERRQVIAERLIEAGADVRPGAAKGFTALLFAVRNGDRAMTRLLLDAGADVNDPGGDGTHALALAVVSGRDDLAVFLLEQGADPNGVMFGIPALHAAAGPIGMWLREWLHLRRAGVTHNLLPFPLARRPALVKALLASGADPNGRITTSTTTLFFTKVSLGAFDLFSNGTGDLRGATPLWVAAYASQGGHRINAGEGDLAEDAQVREAAPSYAQVMQILLEAGADPNLATADGTTPLMAAAGLGHGGGGPERPRPQAVPPVQLLLDAGADVDAVNEAGFTALHGAAFVGINEVVQVLADHGANLDAQDFMERTPFRIAEGAKQQFSMRSSPHTAELLKNLGADTSLGVPGEVLQRQLQRDGQRPADDTPR